MTCPSRLFRSSEKAQLGSALITSAPIPDICFGPGTSDLGFVGTSAVTLNADIRLGRNI